MRAYSLRRTECYSKTKSYYAASIGNKKQQFRSKSDLGDSGHIRKSAAVSWCSSTVFLSRPGHSLLADKRICARTLDVQLGEPITRHWTLFGVKRTDQSCDYLDGSRSGRLASLRSANMGDADDRQLYYESIVWRSFFNTGTSGRNFGWLAGTAKSWNGRTGMALRLRMVLHRATNLAALDAAGIKHKPVAKNSGRMGTDIQ